jgi:hypothetical protein
MILMLLIAAPVWSNGSALTIEDGRFELGLTSEWRYGLEDDLEISTQPIADLLFPHLGAKKHWGSQGPWHLASAHSIGLSSVFLGQVAREGSGGLLPADLEIPFSFLLGADALVSRELGAGWLTFGAGLTLGPTFGDETPILDFPFLYPRFAALNAPVSSQLEARLEGQLGWLGYAVELALYAWPGLDRGWAFEQALALAIVPSDHFRLELGVRTSVADYPIGTRFHALPTFDIAVGF